MMRTRDIVRDESGFSVSELLVAAAIGLLVLGVAYLLFETAMKGFRQVEGSTIATRMAATCMTRIQRPLREATRVTFADDYEIRFTSDPDDDGRSETFHSYIETGTTNLVVESAEPSETANPIIVANGVRNRVMGEPLFGYYTRGGAPLTGAAKLKPALVRVLVITQARVVKPTPPYRVRTDVYLRNHTDQ